MKKILVVILILVAMVFGLCGCNQQIGIDTVRTFNWAIIQLGNGELIEGPVTSWRDFSQSDCVQFTINGITYLTHYSNVILCTDKP